MKTRGVLLLPLVTLLWGLTFPLAKFGSEFIPPLLFAALRFLLGAVCLYGWWVGQRRRVANS
ncbi:hypothetical protein Adeg_0483 [Ammonifex degensii KC4]|uniref:EamA domain-containing protein n=1 Tax=Ammonifex degensii (strain DSM 10501 / KC4) TaxID=429009 RepID=C9RBK7_AMMDK|nr:EamA family transporter [Ammonifex degensii]ACX51634.1 hypothetical protein Adeg_0483 [Ammonifex degensii KC4]